MMPCYSVPVVVMIMILMDFWCLHRTKKAKPYDDVMTKKAKPYDDVTTMLMDIERGILVSSITNKTGPLPNQPSMEST